MRERIVGLAVRPLLVFADLHEKLDGGVLGKDLAQSLRGLLVLLGDDGVHAARDAGLNVDGRVVVLSREFARENDVPVQTTVN